MIPWSRLGGLLLLIKPCLRVVTADRIGVYQSITKVESDRRHGPDVGDWECISHILKWPGIRRLTITSTKYGLVIPAEGKSYSGKKLSGSGIGAAVKGYAAQATGENPARIRIKWILIPVLSFLGVPNNSQRRP